MEPRKSKKMGIFFLCICALALFVSVTGKTDVQALTADPGKMEEAKRAVRLKDYVKAAELFNVLAEAGSEDALYQLGALYQTGKGVKKDYTKALYLFQQAAEKGQAKAQYSLAQMYENGWGTTPDQQHAFIWYTRSAEGGYRQALTKVKRIQAGGLLTQNNPNVSKDELLRIAAGNGRMTDIAQLLNMGADINSRDQSGRTALLEAVAGGRLEAARFLLQKGAHTGMFDNDGDNALLLAVEKKNTDLVKALLAAGADIDAANKHGLTPLMLAVKNNDTPLVKFLIDNKADVKKVDVARQDAFQLAQAKGYKEITDMLLETGQVSRPSNEKEPAALKAVIENLKTVRGGFGVVPSEKWTALMLAAWRGESDIVKMLVAEKKDVNATGRDGHTALSLAAWRGHVAIVDMLLRSGASLELSADERVSPLILAALNGHAAVAGRLVKEYKISGSSSNLLNKALDVAIKNGHGVVGGRIVLEYRKDAHNIFFIGRRFTGRYQLNGNIVGMRSRYKRSRYGRADGSDDRDRRRVS
jgi:ankyrin repeat protein